MCYLQIEAIAGSSTYSYLVGVDGPGPGVLQLALFLQVSVVHLENAPVAVVQSQVSMAASAVFYGYIL